MTHPWSRKTAGQDLRAGLVLGVESIPDGLAAGLLAGVNPVFGLYGYLVGTVAGALATSSVFMSVQATGAMAVIIADVPSVRAGPDSARALFTLSMITGLVMLGLGLLKMGTLVRFVPNAVLTGFINAVAVNIVLGQLANLTGHASEAANRVTRAIDTVLHVASFDWPTLAIGLVTIALILLLERTPVGSLGLVVAVVLTSATAALLKLDSVQTLSDIATIPSTLPRPAAPDLALAPHLLVPALSLALVGLVQGAAISNSIPNPDGLYPDASGDFRGQGVASVAAGVFQGMPVAGSMSATSLVTAAGARSRLANLSAGLTMALLIVTVGGLVGGIAMPALAGLLILVGFRTFKADNVAMVWRTGPTQATVMVTTFVLTLLIPLQYAVLVGVGLSVILYVASESNKVTLTRWVYDQPGGLPIEAPVPGELPAGQTIVLQPYGSLFFAAAPVFEGQLPRVTAQSTGSVVIVRLRGKQELGSTFINVISRYSNQLNEVGSALMLAGLGDRVYRQLETTGVLEAIGSDAVFKATPRVTESLQQALVAAEGWKAEPGDPPDPG
ncbi:MAG: SulP family inorganic anion transporter [Dermatophilaceae bacterium]